VTGLVGLEAPPEPPAGVEAPDQGANDPVRSNPLRLLAVVAALVALGLVFGPLVFLLVVALIVSIFLHEMGHFVVARRSGMLATEFFIGMGPRVWSFRRGEVEYGLKAIPLGAYVRIVGMSNLEQVDPADEHRTFRVKNYPRRLATVLAGPAVNIAIGVVLFFGLFVVSGVNDPGEWSVGSVADGAPASQAGLEPGDRITAVNGVAVGDWDAFTGQLNNLAGQQVNLQIERGGDTLTIPTALGWALSESGSAAIPTDPALPPRSLAVSVNGTAISTYDEFAAAVSGPGAVDVDFDVNGGIYRATLPGSIQLPDDAARGFLGVTRASVGTQSVGVAGAASSAVGMVGEVASSMFEFLGRLFSPSGMVQYFNLVTGRTADSPAPTDQLLVPLEPVGSTAPIPTSGGGTLTSQSEAEIRPLSLVGIVQVGDQLGSQMGIASILFLLAMVNVFLGLINLLPLLPFDGGHATVATYEAVRGAIARRPYRVDTAKLMPATYVVVFILLGVGLSAMYLDIVNPVRLVP
jgi:membrane-associated protease RseP (regulator of RpoE activity)